MNNPELREVETAYKALLKQDEATLNQLPRECVISAVTELALETITYSPVNHKGKPTRPRTQREEAMRMIKDYLNPQELQQVRTSLKARMRSSGLLPDKRK